MDPDDDIPSPPARRSDPPAPTDVLAASGSRPGSGYPGPGPVRISSTGSLRVGSAAGGVGGSHDNASAVTRSSSTGSLRRASSREQLQPIQGRPLPSSASADPFDVSPGQASNVPRLAPLARPGSSGRPGSGDSSGGGRSTARIGVPPLPLSSTPQGSPDRGVPPPPAPHPVGREGLTSVENALTPKGPVKWVPHTHANPKHAKFCFICLHGKMDPHKSEFEDQQRQQQLEDADLPSSLEMKELAYLLPAEGQFRRAGADFTRNNLTAQWIRDISDRLYDETCVNAVADHNEYLGYGRDTGLIRDDEEEQDKISLLRLFTFSEEERSEVDQKFDFLGNWCQAQEARLQNVLPPPKPRHLPEVSPLTEQQTAMLDYHPLIDVSQLKGDTSQMAKEAVEDAETLGTGAFQVEDLPRPATHPDMPDFEIKQYPLTTKDVPAYEPMKPSKPKRRPLDGCLDPFQRPSLFLPEFREMLMPDFGNTWEMPEYNPVPIMMPEQEWLSTTLSIWKDNNLATESEAKSPSRQENKDEHQWGAMVPQSRPVVPFIDEPVLPPINLEKSSTGEKRILVRSVWDPELYTTNGTMVPPLHARAVGQYMKPSLEVVEHPRWSEQLCPSKPRDAKIREQLPIVPIRSFARFRPRELDIEIPDWLWDLVRYDPSGQTIWDVIVQRHAIPQEVAKDRAEMEELRRKQEAEEVQALAEAEAEVEAQKVPFWNQSPGATNTMGQTGMYSMGQTGMSAAPGQAGQEVLALRAPQGADITAPPAGFGLAAAAPQSQPEHHIQDEVAGLPRVEVDLPGPPLPSPIVTGAGGRSAGGGVQAAQELQQTDVRTPSRPAAGQLTVTMSDQAPEEMSVSGSRPGTASGQGTLALATAGLEDPQAARQAALERQKQRVQQLVSGGAEGRKAEELISDDRFIDALADRIAMRIGGPGSVMAGGTTSMGATRTMGSWSAGVRSGGVTLSGQPTATIIRPEPPSFAEPIDEQSRAELPKALQGGAATGEKGESSRAQAMATTVSDVNTFTQEKMRGDCYVRLIIKPEANAARKDPVPYSAQTLDPDSSLAAKPGRPFAGVPPPAPVLDSNGELIERDDEFADFEKSSSVIFSFVRHNRYEAVEVLIQEDHTIVQRALDEHGNSLLHIACQNKNKRIARLLIKSGLSTNVQNNKGNTPLHYCYQYGFTELAEYLIQNGADDQLPNYEGLQPHQGIGHQPDGISAAQKQLRAM
mmetsp:Transcript_55613/g.132555  ORF Transcript_55613/g.132555 Transcript_55613/m.132555 type:complete len:1221 (-) Transcript_55613:28-3690(-)